MALLGVPAERWARRHRARAAGDARDARGLRDDVQGAAPGARRGQRDLRRAPGRRRHRGPARLAAGRAPGSRRCRASSSLDELLGDPDRWRLLDNTFKPYPCGIVSHPGDRGRRAAGAPARRTRAIERVELRCHPLVPELTGNPQPADGLQARFSTIHGVAAGLLDGEVDAGAVRRRARPRAGHHGAARADDARCPTRTARATPPSCASPPAGRSWSSASSTPAGRWREPLGWEDLRDEGRPARLRAASARAAPTALERAVRGLARRTLARRPCSDAAAPVASTPPSAGEAERGAARGGRPGDRGAGRVRGRGRAAGGGAGSRGGVVRPPPPRPSARRCPPGRPASRRRDAGRRLPAARCGEGAPVVAAAARRRRPSPPDTEAGRGGRGRGGDRAAAGRRARPGHRAVAAARAPPR